MTHTLNHVLMHTLGDSVDQKGSEVSPDKLRFDFSNNTAVTIDQLEAIERAVQEVITKSQKVYTQVVPLKDAEQIYGLRACFGEVHQLLPMHVPCIRMCHA